MHCSLFNFLLFLKFYRGFNRFIVRFYLPKQWVISRLLKAKSPPAPLFIGWKKIGISTFFFENNSALISLRYGG